MKHLISTYISLLKNYNETTNIYSKSAYDHLEFHIQDSLNIAALIGNTHKEVLDLGSGSGLPAVIVAIANPLNTITAIESKSRKTTFLEKAKTELRLSNLKIVQADINEYLKKNKANPAFITAKAFAPIEKISLMTKSIAPHATLIVPISEKQKELLAPLQLNIVLSFSNEGHFYIEEKLGTLREKLKNKS